MPKKLISYDEDNIGAPLPAPVTEYLDGRYGQQQQAGAYDVAFPHSSGQRKVGLGDLPEGIRMPRRVTFTQVVYRAGTNDSSGSTSVQLHRNGAAVSGTTGNATTNPTPVSGSWTFEEGDYLTVNIVSVGSGTAGERLMAYIKGATS